MSVSRDGRWLLVHLMVGWGRVDVHLLDITTGAWSVVCEGVEAQQSFRVHGDLLVGVTTRDAPNGRVVTAPVDAPATWTTVVAERSDSVLGAATVFAGDLLVVASSVAVDRLERWSLREAGTAIADESNSTDMRMRVFIVFSIVGGVYGPQERRCNIA